MSAESLRALSIRQPWAWLIVNGFKDIENRTWHTKFRGRFLIHASAGMTRREYAEAAMLARRIKGDGILPMFEELERGGIVGEALLVGEVGEGYRSPWFFGPVGFKLDQVKKLPFQKCTGALGFFVPKLPEPITA